MSIDANEHIYLKSIEKALTSTGSLGMIETVGDYTGVSLRSTFCRGTNPIDAV